MIVFQKVHRIDGIFLVEIFSQQWKKVIPLVHLMLANGGSCKLASHMSEVAYTSQDPRRDRALVEQSGILLRVPYMSGHMNDGSEDSDCPGSS